MSGFGVIYVEIEEETTSIIKKNTFKFNLNRNFPKTIER